MVCEIHNQEDKNYLLTLSTNEVFQKEPINHYLLSYAHSIQEIMQMIPAF